MAKEILHRILLVPEILEAILLQLPIQDLLVNAQRVSHAWKTTIDSSVALQQALFFQSSPTLSSPQQPSFNPLLQKAFPPWFRLMHDTYREARVVASLPWASSPKAQAAFMRADACWRKIPPCQPAKRVFEVVGKKNIQKGIFELNGRVRLEGGFRMGCPYDLGVKVVSNHVSSFWIRWDEAKGEEAGEEEGEREEKVTMFPEHSWVKCGPGMPPDVGGVLE